MSKRLQASVQFSSSFCFGLDLERGDWKTVGNGQNPFWVTGICQNRNLSELEFVKIEICQNWNLSESEFVRIGICQNWNLSE